MWPVAEIADRIESRLRELEALPTGWDSYGAMAAQPGVLARIRALLAVLADEPSISLTPSGGAHLTWGSDEDVIVELEPDGTVSALIEDQDLAAPTPLTRKPSTEAAESAAEPLGATESSEPGSARSEALRGSCGPPQRERSDPETAEAVCAAVEGTVGQSETGEGREAVHGGAEGADDPAARLRSAADELEQIAATTRAYVVDPWAGHVRDTLVPWVALMSPDLAAPLAAWLRERADYADAVGFCNDREALALADLILGEVRRVNQ
jgi:hypothetical protein